MATSRDLKILAGIVWYGGAIILALKGGALLVEANVLSPVRVWGYVAVVSGLLLGALKSKYVLIGFAGKNVNRIDHLANPRIWQFFTARFFLSLSAMILVGAALSRIAHDRYPLLIAVAAIDFGVSSGLLLSGHVLWLRKSAP